MKRILLFLVVGTICSLPLLSQNDNNLDKLRNNIHSADDTARINALNEMGAQFIFKGRLDSAKQYYGEALVDAQAKEFQKGIADSYNGLGNLSLLKGDHVQAMDLYLKSFEIREKLGNKRDIIPSYINLSTVYLRQKQYDESFKYLRKAWDMAEEIGDSVRLAGIQNNYATILANSGKEDSALYYLQRCVFISEKIEGRTDIDLGQLNHYKSNALLGIAQLVSRKGEGATIIKMLDSLWQKERAGTGAPNKLRVLKIIAEAAYRQGEFNKAIGYANYALQIDSGYRNPVLMIDFYGLLSDSYYDLKDYKKAYDAAIMVVRFKDSVYEKEKLGIINDIQTKYETEKKDNEIIVLNKKRQAQKIIISLAIAAAIIAIGFLLFAFRSKKLQQRLFRQKEQLLLQEKEIETGMLRKKMTELEQMALRAQMNPHFIFNSLNSVQHFVMNKDVEGVNKYLSTFAHLVRQTLDNSGKELVPLDAEIKYLDTYLALEKMKSNDRFDYTITVDENIDRHSAYIPGMILQPFVENSIKHGVAMKETNDGHILIRFSKEGKLVCLIEDNGVGRERAGKIRQGSSASMYEPKGMEITMNRIDTINKMYGAEITLAISDLKDSNGKPTGTSVEIAFPTDME